MFKRLSDRATYPSSAGGRSRVLLALLLALAAMISRPAVAAPTVVYVKPGATGSGTSWANAADLTPALIMGSASGTEIWVAAGTYRPSTLGDRTASFTLKNGVAIYGGFRGTETLRSLRNVAANLTVLSGDLLLNDTGVVTTTNSNRSDNSYHVVSGGGTDATALLDGVTISGGNANGAKPDDWGGGMINFNSSPKLMNITFDGNSANVGAGMVNASNSSPLLMNVTFSGNSAQDSGGGMYNQSSSPTLTNLIFSGNSAHFGGGMYNQSSSPTLTNVTFSGNSATLGNGGGIDNANNSSPTLTNVTFSGNSAYYDGGGMENVSNSSPTLTNVTFSGNLARFGGGLLNTGSSSLTLMNATLSGNSAQKGGGIYVDGTSILTITNSILAENRDTNSTDPDCSGPLISQGYNLIGNNSGCAFTPASGDLVGTSASPIEALLGSLQNNGGLTPTRAPLPGSPALDAGSPSAPGSSGNACLFTDQRGVVRPQGAGCDIGAYELAAPNTTTTVAGVAGMKGSTDGYTTTARFSAPAGIAADSTGMRALVADAQNHNIREITVATGYVTTLAGLASVPGSTDGYTTTARFNSPSAVALSADGTLALVADTDNHTIRKIDVPARYVSTLAGFAGQPGSTDGYTTTARFSSPSGVALSTDGTLALVADTDNHTIRKIDVLTGLVTTLAGTAEAQGNADGTGAAARFNQPTGITLSADGTFALVADTGNNTVRKIVMITGEVSTLAALVLLDVRGPFAGSRRIQGISISPDGCAAVVADSQTHTIARIDTLTGRLSLIAGSPGSPGSANGSGAQAQFMMPEGVTVTNGGLTALVADTGNSLVRRVDGLTLCYRVYMSFVQR